MSPPDRTSASTGSSGEQPRANDSSDGSPLDSALAYARRGVDSGAAAGLAGGVFTLRALGALREGSWGSGVLQLLVGLLCFALARAQYRSNAVEERTSYEAEPQPESPPTTPAAEAVSVEIGEDVAGPFERLGAAAFDEYSHEVPVPQRAFDREFLGLDDEVYWGIRSADDLVVCTQSYDDLDDLAGVDYVASSRVDDERTLTIPDRIANHWNELSDTDVGVPGGTDIAFATNDALTPHHCLAVVPAPWYDDFEWED